ncbi:biotin-dependent carboxyltransferase family protein [Vulcaniibacterium gelatinicum]|uniref:5-oxoprolinase subunit C family protein n=1 Tax=Vulcaniibacterium gelatinicum TaxID=2598725 RepID=UPI0011CA94DB|nr:biotin-dependent carboxyltransferase family protein [Vulcaniibacterium gelatinicum]
MSLHVLAPGLLTTVQDRGREGWRHLGVARAGALDPFAAALANRLVGNPEDAAVLEITLLGPTLQWAQPLRIALCGAPWPMRFEAASGADCTLPTGRPLALPAGTLRLGAAREGARAWLAVAGGLDVPVVLGSRSTDLRGGFGGLDGRPLRRGDVLGLLAPPDIACTAPRHPAWWVDPLAGAPRTAPLRYVPTSHPAAARLAGQDWRVQASSDRQGLRLAGAALPGASGSAISEAVAPGTIQLPPDGQPIVLLADAQTVGGYPRLGHVIAADLPRLAQLRPGDALRLSPCDAATARALACAARVRMARIGLAVASRLASA